MSLITGGTSYGIAGRTLYVDPGNLIGTASNANDGLGLATAWLTIPYAMQNAIIPGDKLYIRDYTYRITGQAPIGRSPVYPPGIYNKYITIEGYPGETVTFTNAALITGAGGWTQYEATNIYSRDVSDIFTTYSPSAYNSVCEDKEPLKCNFTTYANEAAAIAAVTALGAGSYAVVPSTKKMYVWSIGSDDPDDHNIEIAASTISNEISASYIMFRNMTFEGSYQVMSVGTSGTGLAGGIGFLKYHKCTFQAFNGFFKINGDNSDHGVNYDRFNYQHRDVLIDDCIFTKWRQCAIDCHGRNLIVQNSEFHHGYGPVIVFKNGCLDSNFHHNYIHDITIPGTIDGLFWIGGQSANHPRPECTNGKVQYNTIENIVAPYLAYFNSAKNSGLNNNTLDGCNFTGARAFISVTSWNPYPEWGNFDCYLTDNAGTGMTGNYTEDNPAATTTLGPPSSALAFSGNSWGVP